MNELRDRFELKKAKQSEEFAKEFRYNFLIYLSRTFRIELNTIIGFTEILLQDSAGLNTRERIEIIKRCVGKLFHVINDILYFA